MNKQLETKSMDKSHHSRYLQQRPRVSLIISLTVFAAKNKKNEIETTFLPLKEKRLSTNKLHKPEQDQVQVDESVDHLAEVSDDNVELSVERILETTIKPSFY